MIKFDTDNFQISVDDIVTMEIFKSRSDFLGLQDFIISIRRKAVDIIHFLVLGLRMASDPIQEL